MQNIILSSFYVQTKRGSESHSKIGQQISCIYETVNQPLRKSVLGLMRRFDVYNNRNALLRKQTVFFCDETRFILSIDLNIFYCVFPDRFDL